MSVCINQFREDPIVYKNCAKAVDKQLSISIKEAIDKITGDTAAKAESVAHETAGKAQNAAGGAKDKVRMALDG